jgi:hypothetical protein
MRVAIGRQHDLLGVELVERTDSVARSKVGSGLGGPCGECADPAGRLERPIGRAEDRTVVPGGERLRKIVATLGVETVLAKGFVLGLEQFSLLAVCGEPEAAGPAKGVARPARPFGRGSAR